MNVISAEDARKMSSITDMSWNEHLYYLLDSRIKKAASIGLRRISLNTVINDIDEFLPYMSDRGYFVKTEVIHNSLYKLDISWEGSV